MVIMASDIALWCECTMNTTAESHKMAAILPAVRLTEVDMQPRFITYTSLILDIHGIAK